MRSDTGSPRREESACSRRTHASVSASVLAASPAAMPAPAAGADEEAEAEFVAVVAAGDAVERARGHWSALADRAQDVGRSGSSRAGRKARRHTVDRAAARKATAAAALRPRESARCMRRPREWNLHGGWNAFRLEAGPQRGALRRAREDRASPPRAPRASPRVYASLPKVPRARLNSPRVSMCFCDSENPAKCNTVTAGVKRRPEREFGVDGRRDSDSWARACEAVRARAGIEVAKK
jgi:hypothetical protein